MSRKHLSLLLLPLSTAISVSPAYAAPKALKAHCLTVYTGGAQEGAVPETDLVLRKGEAKEVYASNGISFKLSYGSALSETGVLQFSATGPEAIEGATVSLFIDKEFPRRFDLSVNSGFLSCTKK